MDFGIGKCKKCGTLLVARNTNGLCDECQEQEQEHRKIIILVCIGISLIIGMIMFYFYVNQKNPVTYEDCVIQVVDKRKEATHMYSGKSIVSTTKYYLLFDDGKEMRVSSAIYNKTNIDDYVTITCSYRNNKIINTQIEFNK